MSDSLQAVKEITVTLVKVPLWPFLLFLNIGSEINKHKVWGNKFIDSLSADLRMDFPGVKGYSVRNLKYMSKFAELFSEEEIVQEALAQITWYHHVTLMDKVKDHDQYISSKGIVPVCGCRKSYQVKELAEAVKISLSADELEKLENAADQTGVKILGADMFRFAVKKGDRETRYKNLTIREFTKAADVYESGHAGIYEMCKDDYPFIAGELAKEGYTDLLDCGCGTGPMISLLYEEDSAKHYTGLDITPRMIEVAKAKNLAGVSWVVGDCENLPFEDNMFDAVICSNSFHHYPNPQKFFDSVQRVLRPGGRLILQDYTAPGPILWLMNHTEMPLANLIGHGDVGAYSLDEVRDFCRESDLHVEKLESGNKFRLHLVARKKKT